MANEMAASASATATTVNLVGNIPMIEPKLEGSNNYSTWKFLMKMTLMSMDLWECIISESNNVDVKRNQKALATICLNVKSLCHVHLRNVETAKEAWIKLSEAYEDKGLPRMLNLMRSLIRIDYNDFNNMNEYVSEALTLSQKLADIGSPVDDKYLAVIILSGLPSEYKPFIMALDGSGVQISTELIKNKLLQEEVKKEINPKSSEAAFTSKREQGRFGKNSYKKEIRCFGCNGKGHVITQCKKVHQQSSVSSAKNFNKSKNKNWSLLSALTTEANKINWYVDSGATNHMTPNQDWLRGFKKIHNQNITVANNSMLQATGTGHVNVKLQGDSQNRNITNVLHVPNLTANLLSVSALAKKRFISIFDDTQCRIYSKDDCEIKGNPLVIGSEEGGLYKLNVSPDNIFLAANNKNSHQLWHRRLGHLSDKNMALLRKGLATGVDYTQTDRIPCVSCINGKLTRQPFSHVGRQRANQPLELLHADLCGPMQQKSFSGAQYVFVIVDDYTAMTFVHCLKHKSDVTQAFKEFKVWVENQVGKKIKTLRTDNGREFINYNLEKFLKSNGINHQTSVPYTPEQNGVAERANRTIIEKARCLLYDSKLNQRFWEEAVKTAVYLKNRSPSKSVRGSTPYEMWSGKKVDLKHLRIFGCKAYVHIPKQHRTKLDPKTKECIFVGYCTNSKAYKLIEPEHPTKIIKARDVIFIEEEAAEKQEQAKINDEIQIKSSDFLQPTYIENELDTHQENEEEQDEEAKEAENQISSSSQMNSSNEFIESSATPIEDIQNRRYPIRNRKVREFPDMVRHQAFIVANKHLEFTKALGLKHEM